MTMINERAAVVSYNEHGEGLNQVLEINADTLKDNVGVGTGSPYFNKFIHLTTTSFPNVPTIKDPDFGITVEHSFVLERIVEMLQWVETDSFAAAGQKADSLENNEDQRWSTTDNRYKYKLEWNSKPINSMSFQDREAHSNPTFSIQSQTFVPPSGLSILPSSGSSPGNSQVAQYEAVASGSQQQPLFPLQFVLSPNDVATFIKPKNVFHVGEDTLHMAGVEGSGAAILGGSSAKKVNSKERGNKKLRRSDFELHDGIIYTKGTLSAKTTTTAAAAATTTTTHMQHTHSFSGDVGIPGSMRITYRFTPTEKGLSILSGVDETGRLVPYILPSGKKVMMVRIGSLSAAQMLRRADFENSIRLNTMRLLSYCFAFFGLFYLIEPSSIAFKDAPILGSLLKHLMIVGLFRSALIGAAMTLSLIVGVLWINVDVSLLLLLLFCSSMPT
jgi:hypothetical protein